MGYVALLGVICFGGLLLLLNHLDDESKKAKETGKPRDTSNDGCTNQLFIILLVGGLIAYVIMNISMCSESRHSDYEYYEPRHSD